MAHHALRNDMMITPPGVSQVTSREANAVTGLPAAVGDLESYYRFVTDKRPGLPSAKTNALQTLFARDTAELPPESEMAEGHRLILHEYVDNVEHAIQGALPTAPRYEKRGRVRSYYDMFKVLDPNEQDSAGGKAPVDEAAGTAPTPDKSTKADTAGKPTTAATKGSPDKPTAATKTKPGRSTAATKTSSGTITTPDVKADNKPKVSGSKAPSTPSKASPPETSSSVIRSARPKTRSKAQAEDEGSPAPKRKAAPKLVADPPVKKAKKSGK